MAADQLENLNLDEVSSAVKKYTGEFVRNNYAYSLTRWNWSLSGVKASDIDINDDEALREFFQKKLKTNQSTLSPDEMRKVFLFFTNDHVSEMMDEDGLAIDKILPSPIQKVKESLFKIDSWPAIVAFIGAMVSFVAAIIIIIGARMAYGSHAIDIDPRYLDRPTRRMLEGMTTEALNAWQASRIAESVASGHTLITLGLSAIAFFTLVTTLVTLVTITHAIVSRIQEPDITTENLSAVLTRIKNGIEFKNKYPEYRYEDSRCLEDNTYHPENMKNLLLAALKKDDPAMVKNIILSKHYVNMTTDKNILNLAIEHRSSKVIKLLLEQNRSDSLTTALELAISNKNIEAVKLLIQYNAPINSKYLRYSPLDKAIDCEDRDIIEYLIAHGAYTCNGKTLAKLDRDLIPYVYSNIDKLPIGTEKSALISYLELITQSKYSDFEKMIIETEHLVQPHRPETILQKLYDKKAADFNHKFSHIKGIFINGYTYNDGNTLLDTAAYGGNVSIIENIIDTFVRSKSTEMLSQQLNHINKDGYSPGGLALINNIYFPNSDSLEKIISLYIKHGADPMLIKNDYERFLGKTDWDPRLNGVKNILNKATHEQNAIPKSTPKRNDPLLFKPSDINRDSKKDTAPKQRH